MKTPITKSILVSALFLSMFACKKNESSDFGYAHETDATENSSAVSDSISSVARIQVKDRQFIKKAEVEMEVKDVYNTTIQIEKLAKEMGGFVTQSQLRSNVISEETFPVSDQSSVLLRKFQSENQLQVRVPSNQLAEFLNEINKNQVFLNARNINAEDVTANIKMAALENQRIKENKKDLSTLKTDKDKVSMTNDNRSEANYQEWASMNMTDNLKYSAVEISIKEPGLRVSEIPIANVKNIDNHYKYNFLYDVKNALVEGFYLTQSLIVGLIKLWPLLLLGLGILFFIRKRKNIPVEKKSE